MAATTESGGEVSWTASASDAVDGSVPLVCTPAAGFFEVGETAVTCSATDAAGNTSTGGFTVTVTPLPPEGVVHVSAGGDHSCALLGDGSVRCWGGNGAGQLGNGITDDSATPVTVADLPPAVQISAGGAHTCALLADGSVSCWGWNGTRQLGNSTSTGLTPVAVVLPAPAVQISAGHYHSCAVLDTGAVNCWGSNAAGALGAGNPGWPYEGAMPVTGISNAAQVSVSSGDVHTCAVLDDGTARCWGRNFFGQLGNGTTESASVPVQVAGVSTAVRIGSGLMHSCALLADGTVTCWGGDTAGQLGHGNEGTGSTVPVAVVGLTDATGLDVGWTSSCTRTADGLAHCWGAGTVGGAPLPIAGLTDVGQVAVGNGFGCAVTENGTVRCWGTNVRGQLGDGTNTSSNLPVTVVGLP